MLELTVEGVICLSIWHAGADSHQLEFSSSREPALPFLVGPFIYLF